MMSPYVFPGLTYAPNAAPPSLEAILGHVCNHFEVTRDEVTSKVRTARIVLPRYTALYLQRKMHFDKSLGQLTLWWGSAFHYSTIIHGCQKVEHKMQTEPKYKALIAQMEETLREKQGRTITQLNRSK